MSEEKPGNAVLAKIQDRESKLSQLRLKELLHYDPDTGIFTRAAMMPGSSIGSVCGTKKQNGYVVICVDRMYFRAHRLAWFYVHGTWPPEFIDHVNHIRHDNRISNLRCVSTRQNSLNTSLRSDNALGAKNVYFDKQAGKFGVKFTENGVQKLVGHFDSEALAKAAAKDYRERAHGEFCCHG